MADDELEHLHVKATRFAENVARAHADNGGDLTDLLATYALFVVQEDAVVGMTCLDAVSIWFLGVPARQVTGSRDKSGKRRRLWRRPRTVIASLRSPG
jgi:hypothetical protein